MTSKKIRIEKKKRDYSIEYYNLMRQAALLLFSPSLSLSLVLPSTAYISVHHVFGARSSVANSTLKEKFTGNLKKMDTKFKSYLAL